MYVETLIVASQLLPLGFTILKMGYLLYDYVIFDLINCRVPLND